MQAICPANMRLRVEAHDRVYFRHVKSPERREKLLADLCGLTRFAAARPPSTSSPPWPRSPPACAVNSGRRVCGHDRKKGVHSPVARQLRGFTVCRLSYFAALDGNPFEEALQDNTVSLVPEQVAFKSIFPTWRLSKTEQDRGLIDLLMLGERTPGRWPSVRPVRRLPRRLGPLPR